MFLRLVTENDSDFILNLRLNKNLNQYLHKIDDDKNNQVEWIEEYKKREASGLEYYFVILDKNLGDIGLVRIYDVDYYRRIFTWGSWVIKENRPNYAAIESFLMSFDFAFAELGMASAYFIVENGNMHTINFYNRFGAKHVFTDDVMHY